MKKIFALMIFVFMVICCCISVSATDTQASLYSYYGDNMLFRQNDDAVFAGTAAAGSEIGVTLYNSQNDKVAESKAVTFSDGTFSVSFTAPEGSFHEYRVVLTADGVVFNELTGVVFGELWLAGGQSNMQMSLIASKTGYQMAVENKRGSDALRFFYVPYLGGEYKGSYEYMPAKPLVDYECTTGWYKGSDVKVFELSAVGYYFAENLIKELNVPVGILNANMGGTSILTWLSRETIENNSAVLADCKSDNRYIPLNKWNEKTANFGIDMTCNFNKIIAPLKNFRLSGMIWYQGEGDIAWQYGRYSRAFDALQDSYTEYFGYKDGKLPIIFSQLASYMYGDLTVLQNTNFEFANIQQSRPESRALTSILDVPLDYTVESHAIHPLCKKEVGDKMSYAAMGLVYGNYDTYTVATPANVEMKNKSIYITFKNVGDTLFVDGDKLSGFSICGNDGVYVSAKAEIVSYNTVRVYNASVTEPKSVAYAYTQYNGYANLFASVNGEKKFAVSPFVTDMNYKEHYWHNDAWATCDYETFWHCHTNEYTGFYNTWNSEGANISFEKSEIDSGNALKIKSTAPQFTISPNFTYSANGTLSFFQDVDFDWSDYAELTFKIKVNQGQKVQFDGLMLFLNNGMWVAPIVKGTDYFGCIIEGDGTVQTITLDMNRLYVNADVTSNAYNSNLLAVVPSARLVFTDFMGNGVELSVDDFSFTTNSDVNSSTTNSCDHICHKSGVMGFIWKIINFFNKLFKRNPICKCSVIHY